jgi:hypothetical protein
MREQQTTNNKQRTLTFDYRSYHLRLHTANNTEFERFYDKSTHLEDILGYSDTGELAWVATGTKEELQLFLVAAGNEDAGDPEDLEIMGIAGGTRKKPVNSEGLIFLYNDNQDALYVPFKVLENCCDEEILVDEKGVALFHEQLDELKQEVIVAMSNQMKERAFKTPQKDITIMTLPRLK